MSNRAPGDAVVNFDDLYSDSPNDLSFLGQYGNEKFTTAKVRKAVIDFEPQRGTAIVAGTVYTAGTVPAGAVITNFGSVFVAGSAAVAATVTIKAGGDTLGTVDTSANAVDVNSDVADAIAYSADFREITFESDAVLDNTSGLLKFYVEYIDVLNQEGPFGS